MKEFIAWLIKEDKLVWIIEEGGGLDVYNGKLNYYTFNRQAQHYIFTKCPLEWVKKRLADYLKLSYPLPTTQEVFDKNWGVISSQFSKSFPQLNIKLEELVISVEFDSEVVEKSIEAEVVWYNLILEDLVDDLIDELEDKIKIKYGLPNGVMVVVEWANRVDRYD